MFRFFRYYTHARQFSVEGGYREIWKIAYPLIILSASHAFMMFCDRKFLAMHSTQDMSAALPGGILYFTLFCFFSVTANFTATIVAQYFGRGDTKGCVSAVWNGVFFAICSGLFITFAVPSIGHFMIELGNHDAPIQMREFEYFNSLIPSGVFVCLGAPFFAFFSGRGKTMPVALINGGACLLNVVLDYVFIFGWKWIPAMGIVGAGLATSLCTATSFAVIVIAFLCMNQSDYPTRSCRKISGENLLRLLRFGAPTGAQVLFEVGAFTLFSFLVGKLGEVALAATVIALSINNLSFTPLLGFADATSIVVGQYIGKKRPLTAEMATYRAWRMCSLYIAFCGILYVVFPEALAGFFSPDKPDENFQEVVRISRWILGFAALFNFFDAIKFIFMGALRGGGDTKAALWIASGGAWLIMIPGSVLMILYYQCSSIAVWGFLTGYMLLESGAMFLRFKTGRWKSIDILSSAPPPAAPATELTDSVVR